MRKDDKNILTLECNL